MSYSEIDTIVAIASGMTEAGIGIIRVSGPDSFSVAEKIFRSASGKAVSSMRNFSVNYGYITDGSDTLDEVLMLKMKAPHTYTCEDVIEIDCHGGILVTRRILELILKNGVRLAEPGEFTKRAFLNGRIDLSQAEAVIDVISARNDIAVRNSVRQLKGELSARISDLRERLLKKAAYIEAALDDPEHISLEGFDNELRAELESVRSDIRSLIDSYDNGRLIKEGINTVILGRPNAGKSSLLNRLLGEDRAIVTDIPGTTRDTLEESVSIDGMLLNIIDTAGIRATDNKIEQIGVDRAKAAALDADLILFVIDASAPLSSEDISIFDEIRDRKHIVLLNKSDLGPAVTDAAELLQYTSADTVTVSALTGEGISELSGLISDMFYSGRLHMHSDLCITSARHKSLLDNALTSINKVFESLESSMPEDFYTIDLMDAYRYLGLITGEDIEDDLADKIFSDFCMGK